METIAYPNNPAAEQAILGSMLIDPRCIPAVIERVSADDFYLDINRALYNVIVSKYVAGEAIDPVTVANDSKGVIDSSEKYICELMVVTPTARNVGQYVKIVKEEAVKRGLLRVAETIETGVRDMDGTSATIEAAERELYALRNGNASHSASRASDVLSKVYTEITERSKSGSRIPGIATGYDTLDQMLLGLKPGDLVLLASRPGMGKTSLAINMAVNAAKRNAGSVVIYSLEMPKEQLVKRMLSGEAYVNATNMQIGRLTREDWTKLSAATAALSKLDIYLDDNSMATVTEMMAQCRQVQNLGLVVIDYLQLMSSATGSAAENRLQTVSEISRMLKLMAKELGVPVLCLSQLSRASTQRNDKRPTLSDLRESGSLEQDADVVLGIYRDDYYDRDKDAGDAELIILKNRNGATGTIPLRWMPEYTTYSPV